MVCNKLFKASNKITGGSLEIRQTVAQK